MNSMRKTISDAIDSKEYNEVIRYISNNSKNKEICNKIVISVKEEGKGLVCLEMISSENILRANISNYIEFNNTNELLDFMEQLESYRDFKFDDHNFEIFIYRLDEYFEKLKPVYDSVDGSIYGAMLDGVFFYNDYSERFSELEDVELPFEIAFEAFGKEFYKYGTMIEE